MCKKSQNDDIIDDHCLQMEKDLRSLNSDLQVNAGIPTLTQVLITFCGDSHRGVTYRLQVCRCTQTPTLSRSPPPRQQKGQLVDGRLALHSVRLSRLQLHHLVLEGAGDLFKHLDGHAQRQVDRLVEGRQLLAAYALLVQPVQDVADLNQAGQQQKQVPGEDVQATHCQPAPQGQARKGGGQEAKDEEAPIGPAASHVAQEQEGVAQMVDGPLCVVAPAIAEWGKEQAVQQSRVVCAHGQNSSNDKLFQHF